MADGDTVDGSGSDRDRLTNLLIIVLDDLGYGDLGCHGNTIINTPNIDSLYEESTRFSRFYGGSMCSPARASLMTGRWHYRTGVLHTSLGQSMMHPNEITLAELLSNLGYQTRLSGKWHLGDNYPMRPMDQGFDNALYHGGGMIGYWGDVQGNDYFDPILHRNGERNQFSGYCTDIFTDNMLDFVAQNQNQPFFGYLATNAPHTPCKVRDEYADPYRELGVSERIARYYGMVTNIDENIGRLLDQLDESGVAEDTVVIFTSDHGGTQLSQNRYKRGLRGTKGSMYEGSLRIPLFVRWPRVVESGRDVEQVAHLVDILPTMMDIVDGPLPDITIDGEILSPLLRGNGITWEERKLFTQLTRGDIPDLYRNSAVITQKYKLVDGQELYDLMSDPGEQINIAAQKPEKVTELREAYEEWFVDVKAEQKFKPPLIQLGTQHENPTLLSRSTWLGERNSKHDEDIGYWGVEIAKGGIYDFELNIPELSEDLATLHFKFNDVHQSHSIVRYTDSYLFESIRLEPGEGKLKAWVTEKESKPYGEPVNKFGVNSVKVIRRSG